MPSKSTRKATAAIKGMQPPPPSFELFDHPTRGRGLRATRAIMPGEVVFREEPTAIVLGANVEHAAATHECHSLVAQLIAASDRPEVAALVHFAERQRAAAPEMFRELERDATPEVRRLVAQQLGQAAGAKVDAAAVRVAYCKHLLNSMTILTGASPHAQTAAPAPPKLGACASSGRN